MLFPSSPLKTSSTLDAEHVRLPADRLTIGTTVRPIRCVLSSGAMTLPGTAIGLGCGFAGPSRGFPGLDYGGWTSEYGISG